MTRRLFVYGSLRRGSPGGMFRLLAGKADFVGRARMRGALFDLGAYPGFVPSGDGSSWVVGEVYDLANPSETLVRLDAYEGCGANDPRPHAFERVEREVVLEPGGAGKAWVYVYRGSTRGRLEILSGDYLGKGGRPPSQ